MAAVRKFDNRHEARELSTDVSGQEVICLSKTDTAVLMNALQRPSKPTPAFQEAMRQYYDRV